MTERTCKSCKFSRSEMHSIMSPIVCFDADPHMERVEFEIITCHYNPAPFPVVKGDGWCRHWWGVADARTEPDVPWAGKD